MTATPNTAIPYKLLQIALAVSGLACTLLYPLAWLWPSGWAWHHGAPHESSYFMMLVALYATLGVFLLLAARKPEAYLSFIWFAIWSSAAHSLTMVVPSVGNGHQRGHLVGDVPALLIVAIVLSALVISSGLKQPDSQASAAHRTAKDHIDPSRLAADKPQEKS